MELLEALKVIRDECNSHPDTCSVCPLREYSGGCTLLQQRPEKWKFKGEEPEELERLFV